MIPQTVEQSGERIAIDIESGRIAGWRWRRCGAPRVLFSHATGFCASAYKRMLGAIAADGVDVTAIDLRGHGRTSLPADPARLRDWNIYARDVAAALDRLGGGGWILAGHSCGAVVSALAARGRSDVAVLALIEPVSMSPLTFVAAKSPLWPLFSRRFPLVRGALARRDEWESGEAVRASYVRKKLFSTWGAGVLDDYLEDGLVEGEGGGVRLACAPAWEAATFAAHGHNFWGAVAAAPAPISVLAADHPSSTLFAGAEKRFRRAGAQVETEAGVTHLLPLEKPLLAARFIAAAARQNG
ncbi:MAG: alpha/beta fold hydrolase [Pseudomonadota bacterium]|nr:alpha/beta fold hydrolase [Pseudomonadota bacterium]